MRVVIALTLLAGLAGCATTETATFFCPNGPEVAVTYTEETATIVYADGRTEVLPRDPSREGFYAKPGMVWSDTSFRSGRLSDATGSYSCDQSSV